MIAYFLSKFVTRSLETIKVRMGEMRLEKKNEKNELKNNEGRSHYRRQEAES